MKGINYALIAISGVLVGSLVIYITGFYLKILPRTREYVILGVSIDDWVYALLTFIVSASITVLLGMCILVNDSNYVFNHPIRFFIELLYLFLLPIGFEMLINLLRARPIFSITFLQYLIAGLKLTLFHILFQFSGLYGDLGDLKSS